VTNSSQGSVSRDQGKPVTTDNWLIADLASCYDKKHLCYNFARYCFFHKLFYRRAHKEDAENAKG